ncbi:MAG TPA: acetyl-CoA C-acetyltransferase [Sphingopyxis sp.]|nr:acetyl-CoA C-acetyltransferase [Sphingopyxis sp.]HMP43842.1 acetyl-CoA C-acetyltransferase [Sphingopyxis sp.]HMQ18325.1 acetyl-CoA C-acetyltransferase [Sphingopyxis sp.]
MTAAYIYDAVRTPRGRGNARGALSGVTPADLGATVLDALATRSAIDTADIDDVVFGCVSPVEEQGGDIARIAVLNSGFDWSVTGIQLHRHCASGLDGCNFAAALVGCGQAELAIGGGVESMSRVPMGSGGSAWIADPAIATRTHFAPQGIGADLIATLHSFSRRDVDTYAAESQRFAAEAWATGRFDRSIVPVVDRNGVTVLARDEHMRPETTVETLGTLPPSFAAAGVSGYDRLSQLRYPEVERIEHVHTPGNSSGIVDGASAVLFGSAAAADRIGRAPRARVRSFATTGTDPHIMLTGPGPAAEKALHKAGMTAADIDLYELNEAFASVVLLFMKQLGIAREAINVNGGAIALGHPLGATGGMILGTALDELERRDLNTALITMCVGQGQGIATIIERV